MKNCYSFLAVVALALLVLSASMAPTYIGDAFAVVMFEADADTGDPPIFRDDPLSDSGIIAESAHDMNYYSFRVGYTTSNDNAEVSLHPDPGRSRASRMI